MAGAAPVFARSNLPALLGLAAPEGLDASSKVRKVVQGWKLKKVFDDLTISVAQATAGPHAAKLLAEHQQQAGVADATAAPAQPKAEASQPASQDFPARVVALFDLNTGRPGELLLVAGVEYKVTAKLDANWYARKVPRAYAYLNLGVQILIFMETCPRISPSLHATG